MLKCSRTAKTARKIRPSHRVRGAGPADFRQGFWLERTNTIPFSREARPLTRLTEEGGFSRRYPTAGHTESSCTEKVRDGNHAPAVHPHGRSGPVRRPARLPL